MIPARQHPYFVLAHLINESMFFVDPLRPATRELMFERLRFADAAERIACRLLDEANDSQRFLTILLNPPPKSSNPAASNSKLRSDVVK